MNESHFGYKVRQNLNRGLHELRPETANRLAEARQNALNHQKQAVNQSMLATAGGIVQFHLENLRVKPVLAAVALLVGFAFSTVWMADVRINELGDIDSALLSDDLPIGAFTDKGFDAWLKHDSSE